MDRYKEKNIPELNEKKNLLGMLTDFSVNRHRIAYLIILAIITAGILGYLAIARESMPEVTLPYARVVVAYPGASPEDVESIVTDKIEKEISALEDLDQVESNSYAGFATISIQFEFGIDTALKKTEINNAINRIDFPAEVETPEVTFFSSSNAPVLGINLYGDYDRYKLSEIAVDLQDRLELINGVDEVEIMGDVDREIHIYVETLSLMNYGLTMAELQQSLTQSNFKMPAGDGDLDGTYFNVRVDESFNSVDEVKNHVVRNRNGELLLLKDIAEVVDSHEKVNQTSQIYIKNENAEQKTVSSIYLSVTRTNGADVIRVCEDVKTVLESEKGTLYPRNMNIFYWNDRSVDVESDLNDVIQNALSGLFVVVIVLFMFIGFRESIIVAFVIPLTLLTTITYMNYKGMSLNGLTILGLIVSLGLLVDNAIVVMENIDRLRAQGIDRITASKAATNQVAPAIFASTMTTIAAFVPLLSLPGDAGEFIKVLPQTIIVALAVSLLVSLTITPTLCSKYLPKVKVSKSKNKVTKWGAVLLVSAASYYAFSQNGTPSIMSITASVVFGLCMWIRQFRFENKTFEESKLIKWYEHTIRKVVTSRSKRISLLVVGLLLVVLSISAIPAGLLQVSFFPTDDANALIIDIEAPYGTTLKETYEITENVESLLYNIPEITNFGSVVGGQNPHIASVNIELVNKTERERHVVEITNVLRERFKGVAGATIYAAPLDNNPGEHGRPFQLKFKGSDIDMLKKVGNEVVEILEGTPGIINPAMNLQDGVPQLNADINKTKAIALGLNPQQIAMEIRGYVNGINAGIFIEDQNEYDIVIKSSNQWISSMDEMHQIYFTAADGTQVPIDAVVDLEVSKGMAMIRHSDYNRVALVGADIDTDANLNQIMGSFMSKFDQESLPEGVVMEIGGSEAEMNESFLGMLQSMILAMILVFIILAVQFNSIVQPFIILLTLPMALVGVISGLMLTGNTFGFYAFMGLVALVGIVVNDAIVLVDYTNYLKKNGYEQIDAIVKAGKTRFIPVFATSITTIGGILPLAVKNAYYGQLGYGVVFGLMVATVMTLVYIPIFYSLLVKNDVKSEKQILVPTLQEV